MDENFLLFLACECECVCSLYFNYSECCNNSFHGSWSIIACITFDLLNWPACSASLTCWGIEFLLFPFSNFAYKCRQKRIRINQFSLFIGWSINLVNLIWRGSSLSSSKMATLALPLFHYSICFCNWVTTYTHDKIAGSLDVGPSVCPPMLKLEGIYRLEESFRPR